MVQHPVSMLKNIGYDNLSNSHLLSFDVHLEEPCVLSSYISILR